MWTHTRMVDAALDQFAFSSSIARLCALYHDVEKPSTKEIIDGRITHHHHARKGAQTAWYELWLAGVPASIRLAVYGVILWHQKVFHIWDYTDMDRLVQKFSVLGNWNDLIAFARADNAGRICTNPRTAEDNLVLLRDYVSENLTLMKDPSRFQYFRKEDRSKHYVEQEPCGSQVTIMCGLPGSGKDTHIRKNHSDTAVISLDAIRRERKVTWFDDQTEVIVEAFERAKNLLRRREPFVWNATSLSRLHRGKIISLAADYDAHITIEAIDRKPEIIIAQDRSRSIGEQVSRQVILDLAQRWEPPTLLEAHEILWI